MGGFPCRSRYATTVLGVRGVRGILIQRLQELSEAGLALQESRRWLCNWQGVKHPARSLPMALEFSRSMRFERTIRACSS